MAEIIPFRRRRKRPRRWTGSDHHWKERLDRLSAYLRELQRRRRAMAARQSTVAVPAGKEVVITRVFDAPRERVFEAWTKPEHLKHWFSPTGFTAPECEVDFRVGGIWSLTMRSPEGEDFRSRGVYREIDPPKRLVFTDVLVDEGDSPLFEALTTVTFEDRHGMTLLKVQVSVGEIFDPAGAAAVAGMEEGWTETLDHLAAYVAVF
jgi:uncharacterized protein YndB with AHSA1/START domain